MENIVGYNELQKLKQNSAGRGLTTTLLTPATKLELDPTTGQGPFALVDAKRVLTTGFDTSNWIEPRTVQDQRLFNHGSGLFSYASGHFSQLRTSPITYSTEVYATPFTVNQTTGAITVGTGARVWGNIGNTTTVVSTMSWGQSGNYVFNFGDFTGPTNLTYNSGTLSAWTVNANNTISGQQAINYGTSSAPVRCYDNYFFGATRANGDNTAYVVPLAYTEDATPSYNDLVASYNGTTLTTLRNNKGNAVVTTFTAGESRTHYVVTPVHQFNAGYTGSSTLGCLRYRLDNNGYSRFDIINNVGVVASTVDMTVTGGGVWDRPFRGRSFDMSNGTQIIYTEDGLTLRRTGNTLTNISATADWLDFSRNDFPNNITPVGVDTWIGVPDGGDRYLMKFSINPTTGKVTVFESAYSRTWIQAQNWQDGFVWKGTYVTGTNNQFLVTVHSQDRSWWPTIRVYKNPIQ
jgi:hypothetical protein